jgi:hypothetical protein
MQRLYSFRCVTVRKFAEYECCYVLLKAERKTQICYNDRAIYQLTFIDCCLLYVCVLCVYSRTVSSHRMCRAFLKLQISNTQYTEHINSKNISMLLFFSVYCSWFVRDVSV